MKTLAVVVTTPPHSNLTVSAIDFVNSAIAAGIKVVGVFFYQDGVIHANKQVVLPSDEYQTIQAWEKLSSEHEVALHLCISAAEKRGLTDDEEHSNINQCFTVSGLGELVELANNADRLVQF
jgi:tRNA 2-thiouridine synthesizing protein D